MNILSDQQRQRLIVTLESAPDDVLLNAVADMKAHRLNIQNSMNELKGFVGVKAPDAPDAPEPSVEIKTLEVPAATTNTAPPGTACARIGADTKTLILRHLSKGPETLETLGVIAKRNKEQIVSLMKLLWERKDVKYDGSKYHV